VPFLVYMPQGGPGPALAPRRDHRLATQMDILPTLASLLGRPYANPTLGKDLLDPAFADKGAAFTFTTFRRPARFGLLQGDHYLNEDPDGRIHLYRTDQPNPPDLAATDPERAARMRALAEGFHEWSKYLLSHNKPLPRPAGTPRP
jgi:phosphoglycerol transferase MdoB-like AlkP superfamily enzyme